MPVHTVIHPKTWDQFVSTYPTRDRILHTCTLVVDSNGNLDSTIVLPNNSRIRGRIEKLTSVNSLLEAQFSEVMKLESLPKIKLDKNLEPGKYIASCIIKDDKIRMTLYKKKELNYTYKLNEYKETNLSITNLLVLIAHSEPIIMSIADMTTKKGYIPITTEGNVVETMNKSFINILCTISRLWPELGLLVKKKGDEIIMSSNNITSLLPENVKLEDDCIVEIVRILRSDIININAIYQLHDIVNGKIIE